MVDRRHSLVGGLVLVSVVLLAAAVWLRPEEAREPVWRRPSILVICMDALRADRLGYHGHARSTSPNIDALAARGARFRHGYGTYPQTAPSVASLFTSLYPSAHRKTEASGATLAPEIETLAETFRSAGYRTASVATNPHLMPGLGYEQGFEHFVFVKGANPESMSAAELRGLAGTELPDYPGTHTEVRRSQAAFYGRGDAANQAALDWLDGPGATADPFLLYLHYMDVHSPYGPPAPYQRMFVEEEGRDRYCNGVPAVPVAPRDLAFLQSVYDGGIRYLDALVAELLAALAQRGRLENTLVALVADHGDEFLEHGGLGHGGTLYRELLQVPFLLVGPGIPARDVDAPVSLIDLFPTLCELARVTPPSGLQGRSLVPLLVPGEAAGERGAPVFAECSATRMRAAGASAAPRGPSGPDGRRERARRARARGLPSVSPGFSLVEGEWHLIHSPSTGRSELYRYREDPGEETDLSAAHPAEVERLVTLGRGLLERSELLGRTIEATTIEVDPATRAQLEALGYTGEDD